VKGLRLKAIYTAILLALVACSKTQAQAVEDAAAKPDVRLLESMPAKDLAGYMSGYYPGTMHNHPMMYADLDRKVFVMMGNQGTAELPLAKARDAVAAFEEFLLAHGYPVNGKQPKTDQHVKIVVDGKELVVVNAEELLPPDRELKEHFTPEQLDALEHTSASFGYPLIAKKYPLMYAYTRSLVVLGPGFEREFPIAQGSDAFALFQTLVPRP